MAGKGNRTPDYLRYLIPLGFESFQIQFWRTLEGVDLCRLADEVAAVLVEAGETAERPIVSSLGVFGNPLGEEEADKATREALQKAIDAAPHFGCDLVCGFTGRVRGEPVPSSLPRFKEVWEPLAERAAARGVRIAFENCPMNGDWNSGDWNLAFNPDAWELLFDVLPAPNVGLEWEPCHQLCQLIDPIPQLRQWVHKIFHLHGKDASVYRDVIARHGIHSNKPIAEHRHPGFGDSNWTDIISILRAANYSGTIDIEGWHDPVYKGELEMTGQVHALHYLQRCRGGNFVPGPVF